MAGANIATVDDYNGLLHQKMPARKASASWTSLGDVTAYKGDEKLTVNALHGNLGLPQVSRRQKRPTPGGPASPVSTPSFPSNIEHHPTRSASLHKATPFDPDRFPVYLSTRLIYIKPRARHFFLSLSVAVCVVWVPGGLFSDTPVFPWKRSIRAGRSTACPPRT